MLLPELMSTVVIGLAMSAIFFLLSVGLSLSFGLMRIISLDQFLYYSVGAYMTYVVSSRYGRFWVGLLVGVAVACVIAWAVEKLLFERIHERGIMFSMITSYGVLLAGIGAIKYIWGLVPRPVMAPIAGQLSFLGATLSTYRFVVIGLALVMYLGLQLFLERTIVGKAIRAGIEDVEKTQGLGIDIYKVFAVTFLVSAGLSALAGGLHAPLIMVDPHMGLKILGTAFMIVIIGGLGSIKGTVVSSLLIGQVVAFGFLVWAPGAEMAPFVIMLLVFLVRPMGLYGSIYLKR
ncbi:MAG: branched-chain amino acid ABC transporter permease [Bacillota bacterium]|nr:branched-chain amino acid ABC transporter permease [Bacillota bacterium]MDI7249116.1 branched-chain amino acid ABC transporter permease [Bacillota bacterium]